MNILWHTPWHVPQLPNKRLIKQVLACLLCCAALALGAPKTYGQGEESFDDFYEELYDAPAQAVINDPLEQMNRAFFTFNRAVDQVLLTPLARAYEYAVPDVGRDVIRNLLQHLSLPFIMINNILQADAEGFENSFSRLLFNSLAGLGGILDPAATIGHSYEEADFAQTLGVWGVGEGWYLMLPLLGPKTGRGVLAIIPQYYGDPVDYLVGSDYQAGFTAIRSGTDLIDARSRNYRDIADLEKDAVDVYALARSYYFQLRRAMIAKVQERNEY
ncbi:MAG: VacJ family lipoprotein [Pseudomonadota bacterium]